MSKIIMIRGGHGSGKSTLVKRVMATLEEERNNQWTGVLDPEMPRRKRFVGYSLDNIWVIGDYQTPACCGGDSLLTVQDIYDRVKREADAGRTVLFEGILAQHSTPGALELKKHGEFISVLLTTSQSDCVAAVRQRREARGNTNPFDPKNVVAEYNSAWSGTRRLESNGVRTARLDREAAYEFVLRELRA